eukprot:CAMPEP_0197726172 /NCGR_PEP_ID=MMETSP1434-20131217/13828_1 /TAXON_ID=265543 /ORGANISM="Minutocellus polymorphus, Strain CCMP3303" /LENGTH=206 /DNA_ID=CAMNT_0043312013 /DNA_START=57 /DNA_END=677 /DNA_ORIENTATION=+
MASMRSIKMLLLAVSACLGIAGAFTPQPQAKLMMTPIISSPQSQQAVHVRARHSPVLSMQQQDGDDGSGSLSTPLDRPVLAAVDVAALLGFAAVGKASHSADGSLDIVAVASVAFPFVTSWLLTSPLTGVYTDDAKDGNVVSESFLKTAKGWIVAVPIGIALRGVIKGYVPPISFAIVTLVATLVIVGGARVLFAFAEDFFVEMVN